MKYIFAIMCICLSSVFCMNCSEEVCVIIYSDESRQWKTIVNHKAHEELSSLNTHSDLDRNKLYIRHSLDLFNNDQCPRHYANCILAGLVTEEHLITNMEKIHELYIFFKDYVQEKNIQLNLKELEECFFNGRNDKIERLHMLKNTYSYINNALVFGFFVFVKSLFRDVFDDPNGLYQQAICNMPDITTFTNCIN